MSGGRRTNVVARHARRGSRATSAYCGCRPPDSTALLAPRQAMRHQHRFAAGGRAVVHRGVGDLHAGERGDLGLELEQHLQRALRDLRLIGRVARQEFRALDQMIDAGRHMMAIGAGADEERHRARRDIARGERAERALDLDLALARAACRAGRRARLLGRNVGEQVVDVRRRRRAPASARGRRRRAADSASPGSRDGLEESDRRRRPSGASSSPASESLSLRIQPSPSASSLIRLGSPSIALLTATTSPDDRREDFARRLDALDDGGLRALGELGADGRQFDEDDIAEWRCACSLMPTVADVALDADIFVILGVTGLRHGSVSPAFDDLWAAIISVGDGRAARRRARRASCRARRGRAAFPARRARLAT